MDTLATIVKCADSITQYIKRLADDTGTAVSLAHLEGTYIPHHILPTWIARLGTLTSLRIRDGSVLSIEAASAISEFCPLFVDLTCYYWYAEFYRSISFLVSVDANLSIVCLQHVSLLFSLIEYHARSHVC